MRLSNSLIQMARLVNEIPNDFNATTEAEQSAILALSGSSIISNLIPGGVYTPEGRNLTSVDQILSAVTLKEDLFTTFFQTPLNATDAGFNQTGTGNRANPPPAVFEPENIVLLTDGTCGSTCTLFSYFMIFQMNVRATTLGGRPQIGPIQSVAGVEGAQIFYYQDLNEAANALIALSPQSSKPN